MPRLEYAIKGAKREEAEKGAGSRTRLPITPDILRKLKRSWEEKANKWDTRMIWAACLLCFFAIMRIGKLAVPSDSRFDPKVHLSFKDTSLLHLTIKTSKPIEGWIYVGRTSSDVPSGNTVFLFGKKRFWTHSTISVSEWPLPDEG